MFFTLSFYWEGFFIQTSKANRLLYFTTVSLTSICKLFLKDADLWDENALAWAKSVYENPKVRTILEKCISIRTRLKHEPPGPIRSQLVAEEGKLEELDFTD